MSLASDGGERYYLDDKEEQVRPSISSSPRLCLPTSSTPQWALRAWRQSVSPFRELYQLVLSTLHVEHSTLPFHTLPGPSPLMARSAGSLRTVHDAHVSPLLCATPLL